MIKKIVTGFLKFILGLPESKDRDIGKPEKILIIRQHNQFGDMLASVSLFRAIKENFPDCQICLLTSPANFYAVSKNNFLTETFIFDKSQIFNPGYIKKLLVFLRNKYDVTIVPATVSISFTSNLLGRISDAKIRIGPEFLDGKQNSSSFLFDRRVNLDWRKSPDAHISDFGLEILRPFGINTNDFTSTISWCELDEKVADMFLSSCNFAGEKLIGLHIGAGKPKNRWPLENYIEIIKKLGDTTDCKFIITGSKSDFEEIDYVKRNCTTELYYFVDHSIPELAALINRCDLFITNDTGVMHVAGVTNVKQISIFGPTNPYNWAPLGTNKYFIKKSELISEVSVDEVFELSRRLLKEKN